MAGARRVTFLTILFIGAGVLRADCPSADLTGDCLVDFADLRALADQWIVGSSEDLTGDFRFDLSDFAVVASQWGIDGSELGDMVFIPAGTFRMGDSFEEGNQWELPVHTVALSSFAMSPFEITNRQYCQFLNSALSQGLIKITNGCVYNYGSEPVYPYCDTSASSPYSQIDHNDGTFSVRTKAGRNMSDDPMVQVSWYGAVAYCNWRSQQEGLQPCYDLSTWRCAFSKNGYHLPTEAQWEYAARGGRAGERFPWGSTITHSQANYSSSGLYSYDISPTHGYHPIWNDGTMPYTSPVGSFASNDYGFYDMAGNVWEWCHDWYGETYYSLSPANDPTGPASGRTRILRGGCWYDTPRSCRVAIRGRSFHPDALSSYAGFRVARNHL